jgi:hypothetical protein
MFSKIAVTSKINLRFYVLRKFYDLMLDNNFNIEKASYRMTLNLL